MLLIRVGSFLKIILLIFTSQESQIFTESQHFGFGFGFKNKCSALWRSTGLDMRAGQNAKACPSTQFVKATERPNSVQAVSTEAEQFSWRFCDLFVFWVTFKFQSQRTFLLKLDWPKTVANFVVRKLTPEKQEQFYRPCFDMMKKQSNINRRFDAIFWKIFFLHQAR